jgi:hypothetical protein
MERFLLARHGGGSVKLELVSVRLHKTHCGEMDLSEGSCAGKCELWYCGLARDRVSFENKVCLIVENRNVSVVCNNKTKREGDTAVVLDVNCT